MIICDNLGLLNIVVLAANTAAENSLDECLIGRNYFHSVMKKFIVKDDHKKTDILKGKIHDYFIKKKIINPFPLWINGELPRNSIISANHY